MLAEIILVVLLRDVELFQRFDFGDERFVPFILGAEFGGLEKSLLIFVGIEHNGTVLRADIVALAVFRRGVVDKKEYVENRIGRNNSLVKSDAHDLGMTGFARSYLQVAGVWHISARVATFDFSNTPDSPKNGIQTPKTSSTQHELCHNFIIRRYTNEVNKQEFLETVWQKGRELYRDMPWRQDTRPYYVLVSELMLQQTQVERVIPKFDAFISRFPDEKILAAAPLSDVLKLWNGLGYNRRAKFLHEAAKKIVSDFDGTFPSTRTELLDLPGVGAGTSGAIMVYAFNRPEPFIETNVRTVYFHHFFSDAELVTDAELLPILEETIDREHPREFYWALMDYGTQLKRQGAGRLTTSKHYKKQTSLKGSIREVRGQIVRLLTRGDMPETALRKELDADSRFDAALTGLVRDGLVMQTGGHLHLTK